MAGPAYWMRSYLLLLRWEMISNRLLGFLEPFERRYLLRLRRAVENAPEIHRAPVIVAMADRDFHGFLRAVRRAQPREAAVGGVAPSGHARGCPGVGVSTRHLR